MQVQEEKPYDEINITPMLDLSYVLLVIFIIMCTASVQAMKINMPTASPKESAGASEPRTKAITIARDGAIYLDAIPVSLAELEQRLRSQQAQTPEFPVMLRGDVGIQYQAAMDVMDVLSRIGISEVALAITPKKD